MLRIALQTCLTVMALLFSASASVALPNCPFDQDKRYHNCFGTYTASNGIKYVGEFKDDQYHGQGTYTGIDGSQYIGEFKYDKFEGLGKFTYANGSVKEGIWKDDEFVGK